MVPGLAMLAAGYGWIAVIAGTDFSYGGYVLPFLVAGVGIAMVVPTGSAAALNAVSPEHLGKASGVSNMLQRWGAVFGVALATAVFDANGSLASPETIVSGYRPVLALAAGMALVGIIAAFAVRRREPASTASTPEPSGLVAADAH